jgi:Arc/MetJ-type ribon-helix-helix transcriptional regulator
MSYPPEIEEFVQQELATGEYRGEGDLINQALSVYRELKLRHDLLRADVAHAISQADSGDVAPLDIEAIKSELMEELAGS